MIRLWLALLLLAASPALAQVATVRSGEHGVFSRIVVEAPNAVDWQFGRTDDGYELSLGSAGWRFDMTGVFDRIPRSRLAGIWADPETGRLRLGIGCGCHAIPFEFRPGIIVIDLKDGPPPAGSSFEAALDGLAEPPLAARPAPKPRARPWPSADGYNWVDARGRPALSAVAPPEATPAKVNAVALVPLRDALLAQLSKGMAEGVVDMATPGPRPQISLPVPRSGNQMRVAIGDLPGLVAGTDRAASDMVQDSGAACLSDADLAVGSWADAGPGWATLANARAGLITEFDLSDPVAVKRAARQLISIGFGAEAGQVLATFPVGATDRDAAALASLARLVDGSPDPTGPFPAMAVCNSAAALWAALATEAPLTAPPLRTDAVIRSFSALPAHLRSFLGPRLLERLLQTGSASAVQAVRDAIDRIPGAPSPEVAAMAARLALADDRPMEAEARAQAILQGAGPAVAEATLALVGAQVAQAKPVSAATVTTVLALLAENEGSDLAPRLRSARVLAKIAAGDAIGGFALLPDSPDAAPEAWRLLAEMGTDSDVLTLAVLPASVPRPEVQPETATKIARRLIGLGFPDPGLVWLGPLAARSDDAARLLYAQAQLRRQDGRAALRAVAGLTAPAAAQLRAEALARLGDPAGAALAWSEAGDEVAAQRARIWTQNWTSLATDGAEAWRIVAAGVAGAAALSPSPAPGPLARSAAMIEASAAARVALGALLAGVAGPDALPEPRAP